MRLQPTGPIKHTLGRRTQLAKPIGWLFSSIPWVLWIVVLGGWVCGWTLLWPQGAHAEARIETGTTLTQALLQQDGRVLLDRPGFHLSDPQLSPDGRWLAVTTVPLGSGTAALAETYLFATSDGARVAQLDGHSPRWAADSRQVEVETAAGRFVYEVATGRLSQHSTQPRQPEASPINAAVQAAPIYPATIRVAHHPSNGCRTVTEWQVDTIPFEEYVARVLPAEVPASWPAAALEAMAVAARTYAWNQILAGRSSYDVTDWANFQMMCDERYPSTDAAVAATAGQYLTALDGVPGVPVSAMYSAENGHPTLTNPNVTYLQSVPDLFSLGRERWGHGYGLSQWGAYRRARAGQNYRQILAHYYHRVALQNGPNPAQTAGGLVGWLPQTGLATDSFYLRALTPLDTSARLVITATAGLAAPVTLAGNAGIWRATQSLPEGTQVTAQLWLADQLADQLSLTVDRSAPASPTLQTPAQLTQPLLTTALPALLDVTPMVSTDWVWQGEDLLHTVNSGALVNDPLAADGKAWQAQAGVQQKGVWYGPRTTMLPAGYRYRALFWLRIGAQQPTDLAGHVVARLDVTDDEGRVPLGLRDLWTSDFASSAAYRPIAVDFHLFAAPTGLEFRVAWPGLIDLALDRVEIWRLPSNVDTNQAQFTLPFYGQQGERLLQAAQMDSAGNLSSATSRTLKLIDQDAPQFGTWPLPTNWIPTNTLTVSLPITDSFSGLDRSQGRFVIEGATTPLTAPVTFASDQLAWQGQAMTSTFPTLADGVYTVQAEATDLAGNVQTLRTPLRIDATPPTLTVQLPTTSVNGWYGEPITLALTAADLASGVAEISYEVTPVNASASSVPFTYTQPVAITTGGTYTIGYWATDHAGNRSAHNRLTVALDLAAPVVVLQQAPLRTNLTRLAWQISDDGAGVAQIDMQVQQADGAWQAAAWDYTTQSAVDLPLEPETTLRIRARARDHFGRTSDWVTIELWHAAGWVYLPIVQR